jgi:hypothetical protein
LPNAQAAMIRKIVVGITGRNTPTIPSPKHVTPAPAIAQRQPVTRPRVGIGCVASVAAVFDVVFSGRSMLRSAANRWRF